MGSFALAAHRDDRTLQLLGDCGLAQALWQLGVVFAYATTLNEQLVANAEERGGEWLDHINLRAARAR
ncbi:MAG: hypothetical protein N2Z22_07860 [Turneriella sp.]|nr:hypothetical protein [Turneriella sp.]